MDHLLAKIKGRNGNFLKIISNETVYQIPDNLNESLPFDPNTLLEENQWFNINEFSQKEYCIDFLTVNFVSADYNQIETENFYNINYLCSIQNDLYYCFQKLSRNQIIKKKYFAIGNAPRLVNDSQIIILNHLPDAIYDKENDILYFQKLASLTTIFRGIDQIYREATQAETEEFLSNDFISLGENYNANSVKKANRKRIALALQTLQQFPNEQRVHVFDYIKEYCTDLGFDEQANNFTIETEDDLKKLLFGIEQRYYTTRFGEEKRLANSIITL